MSTYVYAINATDGGLATYPALLDHALGTLADHADLANATVIYTPPHDHDHIATLRDRGVTVLERDAPADVSHGAPMKAHLGDVDGERVILLDADTQVNRDPAELFDSCFEGRSPTDSEPMVAARPDPVNDRPDAFDTGVWRDAFAAHGLAPIPLLTTGMVLFDGGTHRPIADAWRRYWRAFEAGDLADPFGGTPRYAEMCGFALAVSDVVGAAGVRELDDRHQSLERYGERGGYIEELQRFGGRSWDEIAG